MTNLENTSAIRRAGIRVLTTTTGEPLILPVVSAHGTAAWVSEGSAIPEADPAFGQVSLSSFKAGVRIDVSSELLNDSAIPLESWLAEDTGRSLGRLLNTSYVSGSGTAQPTGFLAGAGTGVSGGTGVAGVPTADHVVDLVYSVAEPYRAAGAFVLNDTGLAAIRKLKSSGGGDFLWQPSLQLGQPDRLLGYPLYTSPDIPSPGTAVKSLAFGDWSRGYVARDVSSLRFERSDDVLFGTDQIAFRALIRVDGKPLDLAALRTFRGATS